MITISRVLFFDCMHSQYQRTLLWLVLNYKCTPLDWYYAGKLTFCSEKQKHVADYIDLTLSQSPIIRLKHTLNQISINFFYILHNLFTCLSRKACEQLYVHILLRCLCNSFHQITRNIVLNTNSKLFLFAVKSFHNI